jgi:uncharacterized protein YodC (DUF2158 family)
MDFEPGDIVVLRSGGPDMTVTAVDPEAGTVECWWANAELVTDSGTFPVECLELV